MDYGNICIAPFKLKQLNELKITIGINEHAKLYFTGLLNEEDQDRYVDITNNKTVVQVTCNDPETKILFIGMITKITVKSVRGMYYIEAEGVSSTGELDTARIERSFQNKDMLYSALVKKVIEEYEKSDFIDNASENKPIQDLIIQYNETDWGFLKRMASHFKTGLVPDCASESPKFFFGIPKGKELGDIEEYNYSIIKDIDGYRDALNNYRDNVEEEDFIFYRIESVKYLNIGDMVNVKGKALFVSSAEYVMNNGIITNDYTLKGKKGLDVNPALNPQIKGVSIEGNVIETREDSARIHLNIDPEQKKEEAWWFLYSTFYTAEGSTGWYCMPEVGDNVKVYFPEAWEGKGFVLDSIRRSSATDDKIRNPDEKFFRTRFKKEMKFGPNELSFSSKDHCVLFLFDDEKGIEFLSDKKIKIKAEGDIAFTTKKTEITAGEGIDIKCSSSSIQMVDGLTHFKGTVVKEE